MRSKLVLVLAMVVALSTGAVLAQDTQNTPATTAGGGVTFMNETQRPITFTAKETADDNCLRAAELEKVTVEAGQNFTVGSGSSNVCYCLSSVRRNSCTGTWTFAEPGAKIRLR
jgi:hypothetical protein